MATPADHRLLEILEKWLKSLELHIRYSSLDGDSYAQVQPWPEHQRPSRWIIDLAIQKTLALRTQVEERIKAGDARFSESLELMTFLANLVGSEHIERFIPLADPQNERVPAPLAAPEKPPETELPSATATREMPEFSVAKQAVQPAPESATGTREMPKFVGTKRPSAPVATPQVARTERKSAQGKQSGRSPSRQPAKLNTAARQVRLSADDEAAPADETPLDSRAAAEAAREQVIGDAARLVQWGRKWYELAELIARMAGRPPLSDVRRILKDHKTAIEKKAGRS
jgi:hypothetical protein